MRTTGEGNVAMGLKSLVRGRLLVCSDKRPGVPWAAAGAHNVAVGACLSVLTKSDGRRSCSGVRNTAVGNVAIGIKVLHIYRIFCIITEWLVRGLIGKLAVNELSLNVNPTAH